MAVYLAFCFKCSAKPLKGIMQSSVIKNTVHKISLATVYRLDRGRALER